MKRSPLRRGTSRLKRSPLRPRTANADKRKRDRSRKWGKADFLAFLKSRGCALARYGQYAFAWKWHAMACAAIGTIEGPDICHLQSRGAGGGEFDTHGRPNLLPLCREMHRRQEGRTDRFNAQNRVDLWALAVEEKAAFEAQR